MNNPHRKSLILLRACVLASALHFGVCTNAQVPASPPASVGQKSPALPEAVASGYTIPLAGLWRLSMTGPAPVFPQGPLPAIEFPAVIELPGTTETRGQGPVNTAAEQMTLTRIRKFDGAAWYQRDFVVPAEWTDRLIKLKLERTKYTQVWIDAAPVGEQGLYTVAQEYDLTGKLKPGHHTVTVMVDNRPERRPVVSYAHQFNDETQTNWNGILGEIALVAQDQLSLDDVQVYPNVGQRSLRVTVAITDKAHRAGSAKIRVTAESFNHPGPVQRVSSTIAIDSELGAAASTASPGSLSKEVELVLGAEAKLWDEFSPALYRVTVNLDATSGDSAHKFHDERIVEVGLREFKGAPGLQFTINGRTTFLRGTHDGCVFPLTGHPPMDVAGWVKHFAVYKEYGLNHVRFHTWVPPEAAFAAADRLGIYLQPELPFSGRYDEKSREWLMPEAERIQRDYGNHPSFVMMTMGNELGGIREVINAIVVHLRERDARHLYADGSNNYFAASPHLAPTNDFWATQKATPPTVTKSLMVVGSSWSQDGKNGLVQYGDGNTRADSSASITDVPAPVVGHENGQYTVYPDYSEIKKYTGVTRARNLERFRDLLTRHGLADQAQDFFRASGALAADLYREEIELELRTPHLAGFQLLDLKDFPGQGTALVGVLNAFMESKGLVTPERWREFCGPIVPLARFDRYTWTAGEAFVADLELAHYGEADWAGAVASWAINDVNNHAVLHGSFAPADLARGGLRPLGHIETKLPEMSAAARYDLVVTVSNKTTVVTNRWPLWVYPSTKEVRIPSGVTVVRTFDAAAKKLLAEGKRVLLVPSEQRWLQASTVGGGYATDFWCWPMFNDTPGTMGILCDPANPALAGFPTASHTERQWTRILQASTPVVLTKTPHELRPIVQVVDNLERNEKLGLIFEAAVGPGKLLVCAVDLFSLQGQIEARTLLDSLLTYAASAKFAPAASVGVATLDSMLRTSLGEGAKADGKYLVPRGKRLHPSPSLLVDGDINTRWIAASDDAKPTVTFHFDHPHTLDTVEVIWEFDEPGYVAEVEVSADGATWAPLDFARSGADTGRLLLTGHAGNVAHVRLSVAGTPHDRRVCAREVRFLGE